MVPNDRSSPSLYPAPDISQHKLASTSIKIFFRRGIVKVEFQLSILMEPFGFKDDLLSQYNDLSVQYLKHLVIYGYVENNNWNKEL